MKNIIKNFKNLYTSSQNLQKLTKLIASSKLYFLFTKKYIASQSKKDQIGPFNLLIETTSFCNAKCIMCPHGIMKRPQKIMTDKTFNKILESIKREKLHINKVYLSGFGEPFTDPNFIQRVEKLKKLKLFVSFYTNASLLTKEISQKLINLEVNEINISFNAITKDSYEKVMQLDFEKTKKNILYLIKQRKNYKKTFIRISSVINKENEENIKKHFKFWENKVDLVTITQAHEWGGAVKNISHHQFIKNKKTYPCRSLWHTYALDANGNFILCCRDYESQFKLGNILTHSFKDIQKSKILNKFRKNHLKYNLEKLPKICQNCNFPFQDGVEWFLPKKFS